MRISRWSADGKRAGFGAAFTAIALLSASAVVAESGLYLGGAYGVSRVDNSDFDEDDRALKLFLGGRVNDYFGLEVAANDYGETGGDGFTSELRGNTLAAVGFLPLNDRFELFAKAGRLWWRDKVTVGNSFRDTLDGSENFYGAGAHFYLGESVALRLELERYKVRLSESEIGFGIDGSSNVDVASLGVVVNF